MKNNTHYIKGFTFVEMMISIIISGITLGTMMFIFNAAQIRYFNDQMESSIDIYCNNATAFFATIAARSDSVITQTGPKPPNYTIWKFNDKYYNQGAEDVADHHREITIQVNDKFGVLIKENNANITAELYEKYILENHKTDRNGHYVRSDRPWNGVSPQGLFNPGKDNSKGDQNLKTQYLIHDFKITEVDPGKGVRINFFHRITNNRIRKPLEDCTYDIEIVVQIQHKDDEFDATTDKYTYRNYTKRVYCPSCFLRERSNNQKI